MQSLKFDITGFSEYEAITKELVNSLSDSEGAIKDMCNHILNAGGKLIRPLLVIYSGNLFSYKNNDYLLKAAVAAELIHMASLVHDDIIDNSYFRRNKPSINKAWGNHYAVLCGDYLFAKAFGLLSDIRLMNSMNYMIEAIQSMCHGEVLQATERYMTNTSLDMYYNKIAKKTAIFLGCCCKSGADIAGAGEKQIGLAARFGINLGYAFQIIDDIFDFCGNPGVMGKPIGQDLMQGNLTLPVILLMNNQRYGDWLTQLILKKDFTEENLNKVKFALEETEIIRKSFEIAEYYIEKARNALSLLPKSDYSILLFNLADMLKTRAN
jgi:heptaprenyl diphosphate synthase